VPDAIEEPAGPDTNNDGKVDKDDITAVVNYIITGNLEGFNFKNANLNGDDKVCHIGVRILCDIYALLMIEKPTPVSRSSCRMLAPNSLIL